MLDQVAAAPAVASVISPYSARGAAQVSRNGQIAYATVVFDAPQTSLPGPDVTRVVHLAEAARAPGVQVDLGGPAVENALRPSVGSRRRRRRGRGDRTVHRVRLAAGHARPPDHRDRRAGLGPDATGLLSHAVTIPSSGPTLGILIGLGVGIDYALFIVTRHRNNLKAGISPQDAAVRALNTSGRAVLFAGTTVCIALLGMLVLRIGYISGLGIAAAITVLVHGGRRRHLAARAARLPRDAGPVAPGTAPAGRRRTRARRSIRGLGAAGGVRAASPRPAGRRCRHRDARAGHPGALAAAGLLRRGQRSGLDHHPPGLRTARHRIRPGLQRPAATGRPDRFPR